MDIPLSYGIIGIAAIFTLEMVVLLFFNAPHPSPSLLSAIPTTSIHPSLISSSVSTSTSTSSSTTSVSTSTSTSSTTTLSTVPTTTLNMSANINVTTAPHQYYIILQEGAYTFLYIPVNTTNETQATYICRYAPIALSQEAYPNNVSLLSQQLALANEGYARLQNDSSLSYYEEC